MKSVAGMRVSLSLTCLLWFGVHAFLHNLNEHVENKEPIDMTYIPFPKESDLKFIVHPTSKVPAVEGLPLILHCETNTSVNIYWKFNGNVLDITYRKYFTSTPLTSTLIITRLQTSDSGKYICTASLLGGYTAESKEAVVDVIILNNPIVELEYPDDINAITKGVDIKLKCEVDTGSGEFQYHWFKNSERLYPGKFNIVKNSLFLEGVSAKDNGIYKCTIFFDGEIKESKSNFTLNIEDKSFPKITVLPSDLFVVPKAIAHFDCHYENADTIKWFKNNINTSLETNERIIIHKNGSITIINVTKRDEGFYSCAAFKNNENTQLQRFSAKLKIAYIKPITIQDFEPLLSEDRVIVGQRGAAFMLTCLASRENTPPSLITWRDPEKHLVSDSGEICVSDNTLRINRVQQHHQGIYTCTIENIAGIQEFDIFFVTIGDPMINIVPPNVTVEENQPSLLKCDVTLKKPDNLYSDIKAFWNKIITPSYLKSINGKTHHSKKHTNEREFSASIHNFTALNNYDVEYKSENNVSVPLTKEQLIEKWSNEFNWDFYNIRWRTNGGKFFKDIKDHIALNPRDGTLKFEKTLESDAGLHWCEAFTTAGVRYASRPASLSLLEHLKFSPVPVNKRLELNSSSKIHCKAQGTPPPNVVWYNTNNVDLPDDVQSINGTIHFFKVRKSHKGNYTCVATNSQGTINATIYIDVVVSPRLLSPMAFQIIDVTEGDSVWIDCIAEGDPEPKTQWDRNLNIITTINNEDSSSSNSDAINRGSGTNGNERIHLLDNGTLHIKATRREDTAHYGCTAGNSGGFRREEVILLVHSNRNIDNEDGVIVKAILITMSVVGAYMLLVIGLMVWCRIRRRRKLNRNSENGEVELKEKDGPNDKLIENNDEIQNADINKYCQMKNAKNKCNGSGNLRPKNGSIGGKHKNSNDNCGNTTGGESGHNRSDNSEMSLNSNVSKKSALGGNSVYDKIAMIRSSLHDIVPIGRGEFGDIMIAKYQNPKTNKNPTIEEMELLNGEKTALTNAEICHNSDEKDASFVMIKSLIHTKDENHLSEFKRELDMFLKIKHDNVAKIVGLCNEIEPHYLVFEYTDWGDLKQFLLATRTEEEIQRLKETDSASVITKKTGNTIPLLIPQMLALAHQISKGMECIADNRFVHKDLATRNCVISSKFIAKVTLPALTKDTYSKEYCKNVNQIIPLRWLPYECVYDGDYSTKSDVYMFACTVWEIFYKAELPFIKMSDSSVMTNLKNNTLTWKPHDDMPHNLIDLLVKCWDLSPKNRPTFTETTRTISKILKESSASNTAK